MANLKVNLTATICRDTQPPTSGRLHVYDLKTPGLVLVVTPAGTKSFVLYRRVDGKPTRILLGHFPATTLDQARDVAKLRGAQIFQGIDPNEQKRARRRDLTLSDVFDRFLERTKTRGSTSTATTHKSRWDTCLVIWNGRTLSSISREDIAILHSTIGKERGKTTANRAIQLLRAVYNHAIDILQLATVNLCSRIEMFRETARERYLKADELPRFFQAGADEPDEVFRDFFAVCLWTGARRGNVQAMKWVDVNLVERVWTIPAATFKTRKIMQVVLSEEALDILKRRRLHSFNEYAFGSHGRTGHLVEPKSAWARLLSRAGLSDLRIHDLRRTLGSWQAAQGASLHVIGKSLGHSRPETTQIYARLDLDPVRLSVEATTKAISEASKGEVK